MFPVLSRAELAIRLLDTSPEVQVGRFEKFEISFLITGSASGNPQWPFDPEPPAGIPPAAGISVDAIFVDPTGREHRQPGFFCQEFQDEIREGREWVYPTDRFVWKVRFSPNLAGEWQYRITARDRGGSAETPAFPLLVAGSSRKGFIRVSRSDPRYFEYDDGTLFTGLGLNLDPYLNSPVLQGEPEFRTLGGYGVNFVRIWISSIFGSAWTPYVGARNRYGGYLPITGLIPFSDPESGQTTLTMRIDYEPGGDLGWFDACRFGWSELPEAVKPRTTYKTRAKYRGIGIEGPRRGFGDYGFVVKLGGWFPQCYEPGTSRPVTGHGRNNSTWGYVEGSWNSGNRNFLPRMYLALENARRGAVYVQDISLREDLGGGRYGPEIMTRSSMEHHLYVPEKRAYALDKILRLAERYGIYLKMVVMEKGDEIYQKLEDDGRFALEKDNADGFYGLGRPVNKTRWLQQSWWRYLQARWGYSANVHSWELTNEGDPGSKKHYELADEFGKFMHCRVFGVEVGEGDGAACGYDHPNGHLVTTSFWHSFPAEDFWASPGYPNVDYADLHAYVSTSRAPQEEKRKMEGDAAHYHVWHSRSAAGSKIGKPVVRGEAGLDAPGRQSDTALALSRDRTGVWLHNFLWSGLDSGGMYELYWWRSHIWNKTQDHRGAFRRFGAFLSELPLNRGGYQDWGGAVSNPAIRVVGQKNPASGAAHLWIQNSLHTWKNVADGRKIEPVSGEITLPGFEPGAAYVVEWWDTYAAAKSLLSAMDLTADPLGVLNITVQPLARDVATTVRKKATAAP